MVGIYKITSPTSKVYIGQSWDIERRFRGYYNDGAKSQKKLQSSLKKYGVENHKFEVTHELPKDIDQETLDRYEQLYMDSYRECKIELLNIREAGSRGKQSEETKQLMSKNKQGVPVSEETKIKISKTLTGRTASEETRNKMSVSRTGLKHTESAKEKMRLATIGRESNSTNTIWINNGIINKRIKEEQLNEDSNKNFVKGKLKHKKHK